MILISQRFEYGIKRFITKKTAMVLCAGPGVAAACLLWSGAGRNGGGDRRTERESMVGEGEGQ